MLPNLPNQRPTLNHSINSTNSNNSNNSNNDDDINFELLTEGLGFQKTLLPRSSKNESKLPPSFLAPRNTLNSLSGHRATLSLDEKKNLLKTSFSVAEKPLSLPEEILADERTNISENKSVGPYPQFVAWLLDMGLLTLAVIGALIFLDKWAPGVWTNSSGKVLSSEIIFYFSSFFIMLYLMYFSLAEAFGGQSVGKYVMKFSVVNEFGERPKIYQTLFRSLLSLGFLLTGGLFAVYQVHGTLSKTSLEWNKTSHQGSVI